MRRSLPLSICLPAWPFCAKRRLPQAYIRLKYAVGRKPLLSAMQNVIEATCCARDAILCLKYASFIPGLKPPDAGFLAPSALFSLP